MTTKLFENKKLSMPVFTIESALSEENDKFTSLSTSALLAKSEVPYSHRRVADNYVIIKRIYKFQAVQSRITNAELALLQKYDFSPLECSTIKQVNEELAYLKKWSTATNELLSQDADEIIQIRAKELKYIVASKYASKTNEVYEGYKALERYFEEITKYNR
ncbi:hypothetical protein KBA27_03925 [bacterium]|nr:hypothetical protein [bacterium]